MTTPNRRNLERMRFPCAICGTWRLYPDLKHWHHKDTLGTPTVSWVCKEHKIEVKLEGVANGN